MNWLKNNIGVLLIIIGIVSFVVINNFFSTDNNDHVVQNVTSEIEYLSNEIHVEIKGEVHLPGIYVCDEDDRIVDLINKAGGLTDQAFIDNINRSRKLEDQMSINIPRRVNQSSESPIISRYINVEVKGEVRNPGLYKVAENAIINDLLMAAGGLNSRADISHVNIAKKLNEGDSIIIPAIDDSKIYVEIKGEVNYPGVYLLEEKALLIDLVNAAGGFLEGADTDHLNLVEPLSNSQVVKVDSLLKDAHILAVDIKGAVKEPGVYYFKEGLRLLDIINMAGGFDDDADYQQINLSKILGDEDLIVIPRIEEDSMITVDLKGEVKYPGVYYMKEGSRLLDLIQLAGGFRPDAETLDLNFSEILEDESLIVVNKMIYDQINIFVEIKGEVFFPGIYTMLPGDRLLSLINRAGGFTIDADINAINQTRLLSDEDVIYIPNINDEKIYININGEVFNPGTYYVSKNINMLDLIFKAGGLTINADLNKIDFNQIINEESFIHIPSINDSFPQLPNDIEGLVNINTANQEELQTLSGIGIILAERIIEYRDNNGGFTTIEDIMKISGIKEYIYEKIKDDITV